MTIYFTNVGCIKFTIKKTLQGALKHLNQPVNEIEMSLSFVGAEEIRGLNKQYRNVDAVTHVLSFPTIDNPELKIIEKDTFALDSINPETGKLNIGDIIICLERAKEQAVEYNHSLKRELCFLSLHGLLHLLGYDHMTADDEQRMTALQSEILNKMRIVR